MFDPYYPFYFDGKPKEHHMTSYAPEVQTDNTGKWAGNALRFATKEEAEANVHDLMMRWLAVHSTRVIETPDPVNYKWVDGKLEAV